MGAPTAEVRTRSPGEPTRFAALDPTARLAERTVEGDCLDARPREPVEDRPSLGVRLLEALEEDPDHRVVRDELAPAHIPVRLSPERRPGRGRRAKQVTGRQDRHPECPGQDRRLSPLPGPRRPQEHYDGHA